MCFVCRQTYQEAKALHFAKDKDALPTYRLLRLKEKVDEAKEDQAVVSA